MRVGVRAPRPQKLLREVLGAQEKKKGRVKAGDKSWSSIFEPFPAVEERGRRETLRINQGQKGGRAGAGGAAAIAIT
jgi:hypothetical protein